MAAARKALVGRETGEKRHQILHIVGIRDQWELFLRQLEAIGAALDDSL